jgi:hypothetical protein
MNDYMITHQDNYMNKEVKLMNYTTFYNRKFLCYELENEHLVVVDKCSENPSFLTLKIVSWCFK